MKKIVRKRLLKIAYKFIKSLNLPEKVKVSDIVLTGSMANYNWSKYSDIDIHVLIPFSQVNEDTDLVKNYMDAKKNEWNEKYDIHIFDFEVQMYVEDADNPDSVSGGIYTVAGDYWIKHPDTPDAKINYARVKKYVNKIMRRYRYLKSLYNKGDKTIYGDISNLKDAIQGMRSYGLTGGGGGEFSAENIAFKALRRNGVIDDLRDIKTDLTSRGLSIGSKRRRGGDDDAKNKDKDGGGGGGGGEKSPNKDALGRYLIAGKRFVSLRKAERALGIPKSTIEYRLKSKNPKYSNYRILPI